MEQSSRNKATGPDLLPKTFQLSGVGFAIQEFANINETVISVSFKKIYKSFIGDINKYIGTGATFSHASINQE